MARRALRSGFTAIELLLTLGLITVSAGMAVPVYRQYLIRSDLEIARQNISQGIQRAKFLSQVAMNDSSWGFSTDALPGRGVLFMGDSYATRNAEFDEEYSIPQTIAISGLSEVSFSKITGRPEETGTIVLTALNGEQRMIAVSVGDDGTVSIPEDWMEICVDPYGENPRTVRVPDSLWEYYEGQGAQIGACGSVPEADDDDADDDADDDDDDGGDADFVIDGDTVVPNQNFTCELKVLGAAITSGGSHVPVTLQAKFGGVWVDVFGPWNMAVDADVNDGQQHTYDCTNIYTAGTQIEVRAQSWQKKSWWYSGASNTHWNVIMMHNTNNEPGNDHIWVLRDGDPVPDVPGMSSQASIEDFVSDYVNLQTGLMQMGPGQAVYLFELGTNDLNSSAADFQDLVLLLTLRGA